MRKGYKTPETRLNGLVHWLNTNGYYVSGNYMQFLKDSYQKIIEYARSNKIQYKGKGRKGADDIARQVDTLNKFHHFASWIFKNYKNDKGGVSGDVKTTSDTNVCTV